MPDLKEAEVGSTRKQNMDMEPTSVHPANNFYSRYIKRFLDVVLSGMALIVLSPVFLIVSILELKLHGHPIIYKTKRPGKDGKLFEMYKFRSMTNKCGSDGYLLPPKDRLTPFGRFIRKTSIDELPELVNIFKGDMSIIGPRPLLVEYLDYYTPRHAMRHTVRPGLACFRIIPTDSTTWTWREQFENDIYYIEHISFITDVRMIIAVIKEVFKASDVRGNANRVPFLGDNLDDTRSREEVGTVIHFDSISRMGEGSKQ